MIGSLTGIIKTKQPPWLLLEVSGVGYELEAPMTTFYDMPEVGETVTLHTHLVVREDAQLLYGFSRLNQRELFRSLIKLNGIGPKVALAIQSTMNAEEFQACVMVEDTLQLTRVPGIGKKTAERLVIEMRDKVENIFTHSTDLNISATDSLAGIADPATDAISALVALGYKPIAATKAVRALDKDLNSEQMIRQALRNMAKHS